MLQLGQVVLGVYGLLLIAGGVMGKVKTDSNVSLIAGLASGMISLYSLWVSTSTPVIGIMFGLLLSLLMTGVFISRFVRTRKFMPAGMILVISILTAATLAVVRNQLGEEAVSPQQSAARKISCSGYLLTTDPGPKAYRGRRLMAGIS